MGMHSPPGRAQSRLIPMMMENLITLSTNCPTEKLAVNSIFPSRQSLPPANPPPAVPAIHRGQQPASEVLLSGFAAHGATNLFHRGHHPLLEGILAGVTAHGELQELPTRLHTPPFPSGRYLPTPYCEPSPTRACELLLSSAQVPSHLLTAGALAGVEKNH